MVSVGFDKERDRVFAKLESGKNIHGQGLLYTVGRQANSDLMNIEAAGLASDARGKLVTNENFQTAVPHIYAAGDVIGFPALASTSMEQGRLASCHMFGKPGKMPPNLIPYGIYTIPEISMVGRTEEQLTLEKIPYEVGLARYAELAKGQMLGDDQGLLKLLFDPETPQTAGCALASATAPLRSFISARRCSRSAAPWNTSATRCLTTPRWRKLTKSPPWMASTSCKVR